MNRFDLSSISQIYNQQKSLNSWNFIKNHVEFELDKKKTPISAETTEPHTYQFLLSKLDITFLLHIKINFLNECLENNYQIAFHKSFDPIINPSIHIVNEGEKPLNSNILFVNKENFSAYFDKIHPFIAKTHLSQLFTPIEEVAFNPIFTQTLSNYFDFFESLCQRISEQTNQDLPYNLNNLGFLSSRSGISNSRTLFEFIQSHNISLHLVDNYNTHQVYDNSLLLKKINTIQHYSVQQHLMSDIKETPHNHTLPNELITDILTFSSQDKLNQYLENSSKFFNLHTLECFLKHIPEKNIDGINILEKSIFNFMKNNSYKYISQKNSSSDYLISSIDTKRTLSICKKYLQKETQLSLRDAHEIYESGDYDTYVFSYQLLNMFYATQNFYSFSLFHVNLEYSSELIKILPCNFHDSINKHQIKILVKKSISETEKNSAFLTLTQAISQANVETLQSTKQTQEFLNNTFREIGLNFKIKGLNIDKINNSKRHKI